MKTACLDLLEGLGLRARAVFLECLASRAKRVTVASRVSMELRVSRELSATKVPRDLLVLLVPLDPWVLLVLEESAVVRDLPDHLVFEVSTVLLGLRVNTVLLVNLDPLDSPEVQAPRVTKACKDLRDLRVFRVPEARPGSLVFQESQAQWVALARTDFQEKKVHRVRLEMLALLDSQGLVALPDSLVVLDFPETKENRACLVNEASRESSA